MMIDTYQRALNDHILVIYQNGTSSFICILTDTESYKGDIFLGEYSIDQLGLLIKVCDSFTIEEK